MIYHRAHISQCARQFALVLPITLIISALIFLSRALAEVAAAAWPAAAVGQLLLLQILKYAPQMLTASLATGVMLAMAGAYQRREMTAWFAAGLGARAFVLPTLAFALPVCLTALVFTMWLSPWAVRANDSLAAQLRNAFNPQAAATNQFRVMPGGEYVYFWDADAKMVFIASASSGGDIHATIAENASREDQNGGIVLQDGRVYRLFVKDGAGEGKRAFWDEMRFDFWHLAAPPATQRRRRLSALPAEALSWQNPQERADMARRLMLPMNALFLSLLALYVAHSRQRMGMRQGFGIGVLLFLLNLNIFYFAAEQAERGAISLITAFILPPAATLAAATILKIRP
ncbi:MAG: LptF/LptG family permease, partial [Gammaproteobacteria bacterium]